MICFVVLTEVDSTNNNDCADSRGTPLCKERRYIGGGGGAGSGGSRLGACWLTAVHSDTGGEWSNGSLFPYVVVLT
jgi:hypothetical protein